MKLSPSPIYPEPFPPISIISDNLEAPVNRDDLDCRSFEAHRQNCNYVFFSVPSAAHGVSRGRNGANALTSEQETTQRYRKVTSSIIEEASTSEKEPQDCTVGLLFALLPVLGVVPVFFKESWEENLKN